MSIATNPCRLCQTTVTSKNSVSLFSIGGLQHKWPERIADLLGVQVVSEDGLPQHVCQKCKRRVETLERAATDLVAFREQATTTYNQLIVSRSSLKRPKATGALCVSPDTASARPPSKKLSSRRLDFGSSVQSETLQQPPLLKCSLLDSEVPLSPIKLIEPIPLQQNIAVESEPLRRGLATQQPQLSSLLLSEVPSSPLKVMEPLPLQEVTREAIIQRPSRGQGGTKSVTITVSSPARTIPWSRKLNDEEAKLGRALAGGHIPSVAKAVVQNSALREEVFLQLLNLVDEECRTLCQKNDPSLFRRIPVAELVSFQWQKLIDELKSKAPTLLRILHAISSRKQNSESIQQHHPGICMAAAVMLKERNREMCGIQSLISLLLYATHAEKQVYARLNHVNTCVSYSSTLRLVQDISQLHKVPLEQWIADDITFKFIGDNVDKKVGVRDERLGHHGKMEHMFSILAARSRLPPLSLSRTGQVADVMSLPWESFLPTHEDIERVKENLVVLVSRILTKYFKSLSPLSKAVPKHISHQYSTHMSKKSEVAVLNVLMRNEAQASDMLDIMHTIQGYLGNCQKQVASGGDQLTCERQAAAKRHMMDGNTPEERLELIEPQTEDWHCMVCMLKVIWKTLYGQTSRDHGTLGYFKSLLNRSQVNKDPKKAVDPAVDFLLTVVTGHIIAVAYEILGVTKMDSYIPLPPDICRSSLQQQYAFVRSIAFQVVEKCTLVDGALTRETVSNINDGVYNYARVLCHYGALIMEFRDACAEGDGDRVYNCWRFFLPHFMTSNCQKYALEALRLQLQVKAVLSPELAQQILWDRFINTKGGVGRNIPCDLHNEHVNKLLRHVIVNMGSNLTEDALQRAAMSVSMLNAIRLQFDRCSGVPIGTHAHSTKSDVQDVARVASSVLQHKIFVVREGRAHSSYRNIKTNPLWNWKVDKTKNWIEQKKKQFLKYRGTHEHESEHDNEDLDDN